MPHNFDPQTDPRVSKEDAAAVAAAAARAAEVAREVMLVQQVRTADDAGAAGVCIRMSARVTSVCTWYAYVCI